MSAAEIIERIKALPPEEREQVVSFIRTAEENEPTGNAAVRYVDDRTFEAAADRVFERHAELFKKLAE